MRATYRFKCEMLMKWMEEKDAKLFAKRLTLKEIDTLIVILTGLWTRANGPSTTQPQNASSQISPPHG